MPMTRPMHGPDAAQEALQKSFSAGGPHEGSRALFQSAGFSVLQGLQSVQSSRKFLLERCVTKPKPYR